MNNLCRALIPNPNTLSAFSDFEIITVREHIDHTTGGTYLDEVNTATEFLDSSSAYDSPFYRVYGIYRNISPKSRRFLSDFNTIKEAKSFLYDLTGQQPNIVCY